MKRVPTQFLPAILILLVLVLMAAIAMLIREPLHPFPNISRERGMLPNMSGQEPDVLLIHFSNLELGDTLARYEPALVRNELERQLTAEQDPAAKLYLAALAGRAGSRVAEAHLSEAMKSTDYATVRNLHAALGIVLGGFEKNPPGWIIELILSSLSDERNVTGLEKTNWAQGTSFTISYLADEDAHLTWQLGRLKCRNAVPFLIEMAERTQRRGPVIALGEIGDERAIPAVLSILRDKESEVHIDNDCLEPELFARAAWAAGRLKAKAAVPVLMKHVYHREVVEVLEAIGDRTVVPVLEDIVAKGRPSRVSGSSAASDRDCVAAAKIALATLKEGDPIPRYCELLTDLSLDEFSRRSVVWRLGDKPDARAIPYLVKAIKSDPSGAVVNQAITVLGTYRYKAAVTGLIDCLDATFNGKSDWKRAYTPEMFRQNIAESLKRLTGKEIAPDKEQWEDWWHTEGVRISGLQ